MGEMMELEEAKNKLRKGELIPVRNCSICLTPIGYRLVHNGIIAFDSNCDCTSYYSEPEPVDLTEFKKFIEKQNDKKTKSK